MKFGDFKFSRTGYGTYSITITGLHFKGGNGNTGMKQTVQLEPLKHSTNISMDITVYIILLFLARGAFELEVRTCV
jgi:hypothetical protein